jgi:agmatinase
LGRLRVIDRDSRRPPVCVGGAGGAELRAPAPDGWLRGRGRFGRARRPRWIFAADRTIMSAMDEPPRTSLPDARQTPRFAGLCTFCRFPRLEAVPEAQRPVDWALYGAPFDGGVTYRPGARFGPRAIREASQYIKPVNPDMGVDLARRLSLADAGDAPLRPYALRETLESIAEFALHIGEPAHTRLLAVGGDHSIAYANLKATFQRRGRPRGGLALLHFDAHLDTAESVWGERWGHASPFIRAIEDGFVDPRRMLSVGVRGPLNTADDLAVAARLGIELVRFQQWQSGDGGGRLDEFVRGLGEREVYLSFDIDCVDPAFAPGTGTPVCGGFSSAEIIAILRRCAGVNLVGADIVEVLPDRDPAGITALLAAHVIFEMLTLTALRPPRRS